MPNNFRCLYPRVYNNFHVHLPTLILSQGHASLSNSLVDIVTSQWAKMTV